MQQSQSGQDSEINYDNISMVAMVGVSKYNRAIRELSVLQELGDSLQKEEAQRFLALGKLKIIRQYTEIRRFLDAIPKKLRKEKSRSGVVKYICDRAYEASAFIIQEKLTNQVNEWISEGKVMCFDTLTISEEHLHPWKVKKAIQQYTRKLRERNVQYLLVFERGGQNGRPHFHVLHSSNPRFGTGAHAPWPLGQRKVVRVQYLGDNYSNQQQMALKGFTKEAIVGYMVKYIAKENYEHKQWDLFKFRTSMSRGFGTCQMRMKVHSITDELLIKMINEGMLIYQTIFKLEVMKEATRRFPPTMETLTRQSTSPEGAAILSLTSTRSKSVTDTGITEYRKITQYDGFNQYIKKEYALI